MASRVARMDEAIKAKRIMKQKIKAPEGYKLLDIGETIVVSDLIFMDGMGWLPTYFPGEKSNYLFRHARKKAWGR